MNEQKFYIMIGEKFEKIDTIGADIAEVKGYLLDNGLLQESAMQKESIKNVKKEVSRLRKFVTAFFYLLLGVALK